MTEHDAPSDTAANTRGRSRARWVIGNWKQHKLRAEATALARAVVDAVADVPDVLETPRVGIAPTLPCIAEVSGVCANSAVVVFAQNSGTHEQGAHTGEVGPAMLVDAGASGVILGHSERRADAHETSAQVAAKTRAALSAGLTAVVCVGEPLSVREAGEHKSHVISMLLSSLAEVVLDPSSSHRLLVAYEPVWAIGTGKTASATEVEEMHAALRTALDDRLEEAADGVALLYGGSVKPANAPELWAVPGVDGFLVGGASLDAASFVDIVSPST